MLKVKDTYINLKNVIFIEKYINEANAYNDFNTEYIIDFIFGENYCFSSVPFKDSMGYQRTHEKSGTEKIKKRFIFTNKKEFEEVLSKIENVDE